MRFFPDGLADAPTSFPRPLHKGAAVPRSPEVLRRASGGRLAQVAPSAPAAPPALTPVAEARWVCSQTAAERLRTYLDLRGDDARAAAESAVEAARSLCQPCGRSPYGSEVWAIPRGLRRVGLVFAVGAEAPGERTIVTALGPDKMDVEYPVGPPRDWRVEQWRGRAALAALDALADEAGPGSEAARQRDLVRGATPDDLCAMLGEDAT